MAVKAPLEKEKPVLDSKGAKKGVAAESAESEKDKAEKKEKLRKKAIKNLSDKAGEFALVENYQDALFFYNQAFAMLDTQSDIKIRTKLTADIESFLTQTPAEEINSFIGIKNITVPRSILLYWLGVNYALEDNLSKAREVLEIFLLEYPEYPHYSETAELVERIKKRIFKKHTIGCLLPLTGKYKIFGKRALEGIQLAIEDLSEKYSREFKIIVIDTKADSETAAMGVEKLYKQGVAGIIGPMLNIEQAGQEAQKLKIPLIALTQKQNFPFQGDYLFSNFITPQMQVKTLGAYLFQELGIKKVAILYPDDKYGKKYRDLFWNIVDEYDGKVVGVEPYDGKKTDFKEAIQKLTGEFYELPDFLQPRIIEFGYIDYEPFVAKENPEEKNEKAEIDFEALFIPDSPSKINMILPQLAYNDATGMYLVGTNLWHHKSLLKEAKGYNKHAVITDGFFNKSQKTDTIEFTKKFESLFGKEPKFIEAISYDSTSMLLTFAMDESVDSREALKEILSGKRIYEGVTGNTIFDENGTARRQLFLMTIKRGKFVEIIR